ncbi:MAG: recombination protein NinB [Ferruginibacter sp.]|nr:recombination protein NinB [Rhodoferax sp.]
MNQQALQTYFDGEEQAMAAIRGQIAPYCKQKWAEGCGRLRVLIQPEEDAKSIQQRNYYHRYVLVEIAEQAKVNGEKFAMPVWKEHFRELYVGSTWKVIKDPMTGKKKRRKVRISTEDLGVKAYSKLIDQVTAFAATELGVHFSVPNWQSYRD